MPRDLGILTQQSWFLGVDNCQGYPISYRYVICHSLLNYLASNQYDPNLGRQALESLRDSLFRKAHYRVDEFLEVFPFENDWGFVVVDQSNGIYPLVIYSDKRQQVGCDERVSAFQASLDDVINKFNDIYNYLNNNTIDKLDENFQEGLFNAAGFRYN